MSAPGRVSKLERVVVAVDDLAAAIADYERLLGQPAASASGGLPNGPSDAVSGACLPLRNTTLQLVDRAEARVAGVSPGSEGVAALVFREDDRERSEWLDPSETRGIPIGLAADADDAGPGRPRSDPSAGTVTALDHVVISTADLDAALALYGGRLGLRLALDRSFEERGLRILFFRVGGTTVEVVGALARPDAAEGGPGAFPPAADRFGGLAWEVADVSAIRARLLEQGFELSEERAGHKPGTRVCTVRHPTHGVPTLLKGPDRG